LARGRAATIEGVAVTDNIAADYDVLLHGAGAVDRSERGKLWLFGEEAKEFLHGQVTNDIEGLEPGTGCYAAFLTHKGKMLGDMRVLDCGDGLWLDCERPVLQELFNMIRRFKIGRRVELEKRTLERGLVSVIGGPAEGAEHDHRIDEVAGIPVRMVTTDLGTDYICDGARTQDLIAALGLPQVSEAAAEIRRVETGRPRWGADLNDTVIPQEAALNDRAVSFTKGCYVGQETVARLFYKGKPNRHLRGLRFSEPVPAGTELVLGEKVVGRVGSSVVSPRLGPIGLALVRREAAVGNAVQAGEATATVVGLPF
jgi:folate-binding protein YgfZ